MAKFSFEGATEASKPFIPFKSFADLDKGTIIKGTVDAAVSFPNQPIKAEVLVNGHITRVTMWDRTLDEVIAMRGEEIRLVFDGMDDDDKYPKLRVKW